MFTKCHIIIISTNSSMTREVQIDQLSKILERKINLLPQDYRYAFLINAQGSSLRSLAAKFLDCNPNYALEELNFFYENFQKYNAVIDPWHYVNAMFVSVTPPISKDEFLRSMKTVCEENKIELATYNFGLMYEVCRYIHYYITSYYKLHYYKSSTDLNAEIEALDGVDYIFIGKHGHNHIQIDNPKIIKAMLNVLQTDYPQEIDLSALKRLDKRPEKKVYKESSFIGYLAEYINLRYNDVKRRKGQTLTDPEKAIAINALEMFLGTEKSDRSNTARISTYLNKFRELQDSELMKSSGGFLPLVKE